MRGSLVAHKKETSHVEDEYFLENEAEKLKVFRRNLEHCNNLSGNMLEILDKFEKRLTNMESTMDPIHRDTQCITQSQRNIGTTAREMDRIIEYQKLAAKKDKDDPNLQSDYSSYLEWMEKLNEAIEFFESNSSFKKVDRVLLRLKEKSETCKKHCEGYFRSMLRDFTRPINLGAHPWPLPDDLELIPASTLQRLARIAERLEGMHHDHSNVEGGVNSQFCQILVAERSKALHQSIAKCVEFCEIKEEEKSPGVYVKGTHDFLFYIEFFLKALELERDNCTQILDQTNVSGEEFDVFFAEVIESPVNSFMELAEDVISVKRANRITVLLDILENWQHNRTNFQDAFGTQENGNHLFGSVIQFQQQTIETVQKEITDRIYTIKNHPHKQLRMDGGYHTITVDTIRLIKQLSEYIETVEIVMAPIINKLVNSSHTPQSQPQPVIKLVVTLVLEALEENINQKSTNYKNASLVYMFLLNNYHYISKNIKNSDLLEIAGVGFVPRYQRLIRHCRNQYSKVSWTKALTYLDTGSVPQHIKSKGHSLSSSERKMIKNKFSGFNEVINHLYRTQKQFSVPDSDLRSQLRNENVELILPPYKKFLDVFKDLPFSTHKDKYVAYDDSAIEQMLNKFFDEEA